MSNPSDIEQRSGTPDLLAVAHAHQQAGRVQEAEAICRRLLAQDPHHGEALHLLGLLAQQRGEAETAVQRFGEAIRQCPRAPHFHCNLALSLTALGRTEAAIQAYRQALALQPELAEAHYNLGILLRQQGRLEQAVASYGEALRLRPAFAPAYNSLGNALREQGRLDAAAERFEQAIRLAPDYAIAYFNLGNVRKKQHRLEVALEMFQTALEYQPTWAKVHYQIGGIYAQQGLQAAALASYRKALAIDRDYGECHGALADLSLQTGDLGAMAGIRADISSHLEGICASGRIEDFGALMFLWPYLALGERTQQVLRARCEQVLHKANSLYSPDQVQAAGRIRIGYVSPNFGNHPIGHVTRGIFGAHDRAVFEVFVYSLKDHSRQTSDYYRDIRAGCDRFVDLSALSSQDAAQRISADGIALLIDLSGYMSYQSLKIFSYRPAPVQVYWLGHGGGLGLSFIDYVVGDPIVIPPGEEHRYTECILRLPEVYHATDTPPIAADKLRRSDYGLAEDAVVYCAFNNSQKIDTAVFDSWMNILRRVPGSQLWLSNHRQSSLLIPNLQGEAQRRGIDPVRLVFAPNVKDKSVHFARHRLADLFLDTFTYNASTTAIDALWAGLPILTRRGDTFYARICTSLLTNIGLEDMVCSSVHAYEERAVSLAQQPDTLHALRQRLAHNRDTTPLFNIPRFVRHLETGYQQLWRRFQNHQPPQSVNIPPLP